MMPYDGWIVSQHQVDRRSLFHMHALHHELSSMVPVPSKASTVRDAFLSCTLALLVVSVSVYWSAAALSTGGFILEQCKQLLSKHHSISLWTMLTIWM